MRRSWQGFHVVGGGGEGRAIWLPMVILFLMIRLVLTVPLILSGGSAYLVWKSLTRPGVY